MSFPLALIAAGAAGFIALSYEILWFRVFDVATRSSPAAFGILLGAYLAGIALGSLRVRRICRDPEAAGTPRGQAAAGLLAAFAVATGFLVVPISAFLSPLHPAGRFVALIPVVIAAGAMGAILPVLSHFAIRPDGEAGSRLSRLYLANIIGSAIGSLGTGFVLLDRLSLARTSQLLLGLGGAAAVALLVAGRAPRRRILAASGVVFVLLVSGPKLHERLWERLILQGEYRSDHPFRELLENRHGVIAIGDDGTVYGGGVFDGVLSTDLVDDRNWIVRPYALGAIDRPRRKVLVIGLSMGPWTEVIRNLPGVESVKVVEINPGYLELIERTPLVSGLLEDPRVEIVIDDGRRYLERHPEEHFDLIVQNTTWHWRAHASQLLSREHLELSRRRLVPGGLMILNTTFSEDAMRTAMAVFPESLRIYNAMIVSDRPIVFDRELWRRNLSAMTVGGRPVIPEGRAGQEALETILALADSLHEEPKKKGLESGADLLRRLGPRPIITDDNMLSEFRELHF